MDGYRYREHDEHHAPEVRSRGSWCSQLAGQRVVRGLQLKLLLNIGGSGKSGKNRGRVQERRGSRAKNQKSKAKIQKIEKSQNPKSKKSKKKSKKGVKKSVEEKKVCGWGEESQCNDWCSYKRYIVCKVRGSYS